MTDVLVARGLDGTVLALLLLGHVLADFLLQRTAVVSAKSRPRYLAEHALVVFAAHAVTLVPFLTVRTLAIVLVVTVAHIVIDLGKTTLAGRRRHRLGPFLADQALHGLVLVGAWVFLTRAPFSERILPPFGLLLGHYDAITRLAVLVAGFVFVRTGGSAIVRATLDRFPEAIPEADPDGSLASMGRTIGVLERFLVLALVLAGQWAAIALALAAKSIARYKNLERQGFAEYYLVGTLTSILVAVATGVLVDWLV